MWDCPCECVTDNNTPCGKLVDFARNAAVIKDVRNDEAALVNTVITTKRPDRPEMWNQEDMKVTSRDLMTIASFAPDREGVDETETNVCYNFRYANKVFGDSEVCCSQCLELRFLVIPEDAKTLGEHFHSCFHRMLAIGFPITLDILDQEQWPDRALATAWLAAAGGDMDTFMSWVEGQPGVIVRVGEVRMGVIVAHMMNWVEGDIM